MSKKKNWHGLMQNDNQWKLKFHGVIETPEDRRLRKEGLAAREKWNQLSRRQFDSRPRLVKP